MVRKRPPELAHISSRAVAENLLLGKQLDWNLLKSRPDRVSLDESANEFCPFGRFHVGRLDLGVQITLCVVDPPNFLVRKFDNDRCSSDKGKYSRTSPCNPHG